VLVELPPCDHVHSSDLINCYLNVLEIIDLVCLWTCYPSTAFMHLFYSESSVYVFYSEWLSLLVCVCVCVDSSKQVKLLGSG
jgi:hypothetical protein